MTTLRYHNNTPLPRCQRNRTARNDDILANQPRPVAWAAGGCGIAPAEPSKLAHGRTAQEGFSPNDAYARPSGAVAKSDQLWR